MFITAAIIILAGISLYFLLKPPTNIEYQQMLSDKPMSEFEISSGGKMKKALKDILIN